MKKIDLSPQLKTGAIVCFLVALGCVNRGQHAPTDGGTGGAAGAGAGAGGHDAGNADAPLDIRGAGGSDGGACIPTDAGLDASDGIDAGAPCDSMFNFENCATYGAAIYRDPFTDATDPKFAAFSSVFHTDVAICGGGGLAISAQFSPTQTAGEVRIPVAGGAFKDYTGQTITVSMKADPPANLPKFYVLLLSSRGYVDFFPSFPFQTDWTTRSVVLLPTGPTDVRLTEVTDVVLQATSPADGGAYTGTIYVDEIDIRKLPGDGGGDGLNDGASPDVRDAGAGDVRDAPAGN